MTRLIARLPIAAALALAGATVIVTPTAQAVVASDGGNRIDGGAGNDVLWGGAVATGSTARTVTTNSAGKRGSTGSTVGRAPIS
jgi:hypothetical protein